MDMTVATTFIIIMELSVTADSHTIPPESSRLVSLYNGASPFLLVFELTNLDGLTGISGFHDRVDETDITAAHFTGGDI